MKLFILGFFFSTLIGLLSYKKGALTKSGVIGAIITGTVIFGFGQKPSRYLLLIIFFVSSSLLSSYRKREKDTVSAVFEKTGKRDIWQTLANGGLASVLAILSFYFQAEWIYIGFAAAFATVNADTWATEIGVLSKGKPRFILTGKVVEKGISGGISLMGFLGSMAGSFLIGLSALILLWLEGAALTISSAYFLLLIVPISGVLGALADSILGATVQVMYKCKVCNKETEKRIHCGKETEFYRGYKWMNNDMVNFISSLIGSGIAVSLVIYLS